MVPEKYGLAAVAQHLLALFEVRRPGIARWDAEAEAFLSREADEALGQMERQCRELGVDDPPHWQRARAVAREVLIPRYARVAQIENAAAARDYGMWRQNFGTSNCAIGADATNNCTVDIRAYGIWRQSFGQGAASTAAGH